MEINDKKLTRTRTIINYVIAIVLAIFLIMLSFAINADLEHAVDEPDYESYQDNAIEASISSREKQLANKIDALYETQANSSRMIRLAEEKKDAEQTSFDNWLKARGTIGSPEHDPEVMKRLKQQEEYQKIVLSWTAQSDSIGALRNELSKEQLVLDNERGEMNRLASEKYESAMKSYSLKVFLVRLLFVGPILALGVFFFVRRRHSKFAPLYLGFSLFSVYAFFVGLVPYLPSYGGYVRASVGVILTVGLGYYAIKKHRAYAERKQAELKASMEVRASKMQGDIAEKAFNNHVCPSCGKDYLVRNWEKLEGADYTSMRPVASRYCRYCGMQVIKKCDACQQDNYAHLPYCINCGESLKNQ